MTATKEEVTALLQGKYPKATFASDERDYGTVYGVAIRLPGDDNARHAIHWTKEVVDEPGVSSYVWRVVDENLLIDGGDMPEIAVFDGVVHAKVPVVTKPATYRPNPVTAEQLVDQMTSWLRMCVRIGDAAREVLGGGRW